MESVLVLDTGTGFTRAGIAGQTSPGAEVRSAAGYLKHERAMVGGSFSNERVTSVVGEQLNEHRGLFRVCPFSYRGEITNWADAERVWRHSAETCFGSGQATVLEEHPILTTEAPFTSYSNRSTSAQIFFEQWNAPAVWWGTPAVLSLYAAGRTTGLVLDVGEGLSHVAAVCEGLAVNPSLLRSDVGGYDVTSMLQLLMLKRGIKLASTSADTETSRELKEGYCQIGRKDDEEPARVKLPDGVVVTLGSRELARAPELLFKPHIVGSEARGAQDLVSDAVLKTDRDLRTQLWQNVILSGGSTMTSGFGDRLLSELRSKAPPGTKIRIYAPPLRQNSAWNGGSILAGLSTFRKMWVSAKDYDEDPERVLRQRG